MLAGTVLLTGCSERQEASTTLPTTAAAPTTEALPPLGPADMPMPDEAREQTAQGAQAFTEYYVEIYNRALRTLNTTSMRELSQGCEACDQLAEQLELTASRGEAIAGGEMRIVASTAPHLRGLEADVVFDVAQESITATVGGEPIEGRTYPGSQSTGGGGVLRWDDDRSTWVLIQWNV
ncbi:hypothetical protein SAMN04515665_12487 [Blastococcus sp. DSM 46786]|nr:hypothetical protein SAMN04515665_12487 [Blastococcus sp. DSM 46786]